ncbi:MAG: hypothetical protein M3Q14_02620 [bacterium]|nr:hypothetical protein [bacterium]
MDDKNQPNSPGAADADAVADQKSDKSPEELMGQVSQADGSLEGDTKISAVDAMADESNQDLKADDAIAKPTAKASGLNRLKSLFNVYLLLFLLMIVAGGAVFGVTYIMNKRELDTKLEVSELTAATLEELKTSDAVVGDPRQILTIESNAIITGKVVMKDTLDIAGGLRVGGPISIPSITAAGTGTFGDLATNDIQAAGDLSVGGILDVAGTTAIGENLSVAGDINGGGRLDIGGQTTIGGNLNVNGTISAKGLNFGDLAITRLNISGDKPSISAGGAAGGGSTASVAGTDTAGTATINTGGGTGTGILATITFTGAFDGSPFPVLTPNGPSCATLRFYVTNISATQFSIATATAPSAGVACRLNYIVIN